MAVIMLNENVRKCMFNPNSILAILSIRAQSYDTEKLAALL